MQKAIYITDCVNAKGNDIIAMQDDAREISRETFCKNTDYREWAQEMGYDKRLPLSRDYHVRYYSSKYKGYPCYYAVHSAIEHVFSKHWGELA